MNQQVVKNDMKIKIIKNYSEDSRVKKQKRT